MYVYRGLQYGNLQNQGTREFIIVTDLFNSLPGISSVNTVQHATIDEAVFSMLSAPSKVEQRGYATRI
jgi:hypothetical protein